MSALVKDVNNISIGIIGMTEGNGHPYSWSAMFNKYNRKAMTEECPFAGIPVYLNKEDYDSIGIAGAHVTHVYCDDKQDAEHVAKLSLIDNVVDNPEDFIGKVDAVIIATDIGSEHVRRAKPFIEAGLPIFIDKPLCDNYEDLEFFRNAIQNGAKIISSSSMRYNKEIQPYFHGNYREIGELRYLTMTMPKKWSTYGIHALEAVYAITGGGYTSLRNECTLDRNIVHIKHRKNFDVVIASVKDIMYDPRIMLCGTQGSVVIELKDSYTSFRNQLVSFVDYLKTGVKPMPFEETEELMKMVIAGLESRKKNGQEIML